MVRPSAAATGPTAPLTSVPQALRPAIHKTAIIGTATRRPLITRAKRPRKRRRMQTPGGRSNSSTPNAGPPRIMNALPRSGATLKLTLIEKRTSSTPLGANAGAGVTSKKLLRTQAAVLAVTFTAKRRGPGFFRARNGAGQTPYLRTVRKARESFLPTAICSYNRLPRTLSRAAYRSRRRGLSMKRNRMKRTPMLGGALAVVALLAVALTAATPASAGTAAPPSAGAAARANGAAALASAGAEGLGRGSGLSAQQRSVLYGIAADTWKFFGADLDPTTPPPMDNLGPGAVTGA